MIWESQKRGADIAVVEDIRLCLQLFLKCIKIRTWFMFHAIAEATRVYHAEHVVPINASLY